MKIAVLGAGINGISCAVKIKEKYPDIHVTILSEAFTPNTTGDGSGGLWNPYLCGKTPETLLSKWGDETYKLYHKLWLEGGLDLCLIPLYEVHEDEESYKVPQWSKLVFGFSVMDEKLLSYLNRVYSKNYRAGHTYTSFVVSPQSILAYFYKRFKDAGGELKQATISSLNDDQLREYDVVINCLGLGARVVVPDDKVTPIRGQICKVKAPWVYHTVLDETTGHYIIPNVNFCVLGGTHQVDNYSTALDPADTEFVVNGCQKTMPGLKHAETIYHWAGLRPGRDEVRLEFERRNGRAVIHNYGHGGSGFTLFWGCSTDVLTFLEKHVLGKKETSKL
ncbi:D-amino-acid oxidase [Aricia agestis]|uniref:D-amino-acid oxidase n=1 Tax=Aricia agestis TaxID=91739 RepID=UPI001C20B866|nr:D-amino-acid oxidase [Aricia agestis]